MTIKKQVLLSVTGLVIMLVLLVGVSFSFFSYSRVADNNNSIHTGNISFDYQGIKEVTINNKMPITYQEAINEEEKNESNNSIVFRITINGFSTLDNGLNYRLSIVKGEEENEDLLDDSIVYAQIIAPTRTPGYSVTDFGYNEDKSFGSYGEGAPLSGINNGKELKLLDGNIHTAASSSKQEFIIRIWLNSDKVIISDTINRDDNNKALGVDDENGKIAAKKEDIGKLVYRTNEFSKKSISLKIKAESL